MAATSGFIKLVPRRLARGSIDRGAAVHLESSESQLTTHETMRCFRKQKSVGSTGRAAAGVAEWGV